MVHDGGEALLIDTAYNAPAMIEPGRIPSTLRLTGICLTHGHADHADGIDQILEVSWQVPVYLGADDVEPPQLASPRRHR